MSQEGISKSMSEKLAKKQFEEEKKEEFEHIAEETIREKILSGDIYLNFAPVGFVKTNRFSGRIFLQEDGNIETEIFNDPEDSFFQPKNGLKEGPKFKLTRDEAEALLEDVDKTIAHFEDQIDRNGHAFEKVEESKKIRAILLKVIEEK